MIELPCGEKGCSGTPAGPFCDCSGTGMEGQYCSSRTCFYTFFITIVVSNYDQVPDIFL